MVGGRWVTRDFIIVTKKAFVLLSLSEINLDMTEQTSKAPVRSDKARRGSLYMIYEKMH